MTPATLTQPVCRRRQYMEIAGSEDSLKMHTENMEIRVVREDSLKTHNTENMQTRVIRREDSKDAY